MTTSHQPELYLPSPKPANQREIRLPGEEKCTVKRSCEKCRGTASRGCIRCMGRGYYWEK